MSTQTSDTPVEQKQQPELTKDAVEDFLIWCDCPSHRTERLTFVLVPDDDKQDDWLRHKPRAYHKVPAVHHSWTLGEEQWGTYHILDQTE